MPDPTPESINEKLANQSLVSQGLGPYGFSERQRCFWVVYPTGTAWTPRQAQTALLALRPMWCDDYDDTSMWLYAIAMTRKLDDQTGEFIVKFCSKAVNDPLRRAPGSERIHWVCGHETQVAYRNVATSVDTGYGWPIGNPPNNPLYIGFPWGSEGINWIRPRKMLIVDKIYPGNSAPSGDVVEVGKRNAVSFSTPGGASGNGTTTPYDLTMSPVTLLGAAGTLLLLEIENRPLENGNLQRLYTIAYDPVLHHSRVWYLRHLQQGVIDVNTPFRAQFSETVSWAGMM